VNGTLVGTDSDFTFALDQNSPLVFGGHANPAVQPERWFDGQLDDLAVFTSALAPGEIGTLAAGMTVRHFGGLSAGGTITLSAAPLTYVWNNAATGSPLPWSNGGHWSGAVSPVAGRGTALQFFTGQTLAGGATNPTHDLGSGFVVNSLSLVGTSSAATTVTINGGGLLFLNNGLLEPAVNSSATNGAGLTYVVATPLTLGAATTFNTSGSANFRFSGVIDGGGDFIKSGTGKLILSGSNTWTGDTVISAGTLQVGEDGPGGGLGSGDVTNNATLRFERTGTLLVPNPVGGSGGLYIDCPINTGTVVLSGVNSFDGGVTVNSGALRITNSNALGDGTKTIVLNNGTAGAPQLRLDGSLDPIELPASFSFTTSSNTGAVINEAGENLIGGNFTLTSGGGATRLLASAGTLTLEGNLMPNTTGRTLDLAGAGKGIITGNVLDGVAPNVLAVAKNDSGTWTLAGSNTWTGNTTVSAGTLVMNGSLVASGTVTVATAAKLAGRGSIAANTVVNGTLQPGDGFGTITFSGTLAFGSASRVAWELGDNLEVGPSLDRVNAAGVSITTNAAIDLVFNRPGSAVDFRAAFWGQSRSWPVVAATSITGSFKLGTTSSDLNGRPASGYGAFTLQHVASTVNLVWTPLPPIQQWRFTHFATNANSGNAGDLADMDRDDIVNLLEYALGGDPNLGSVAPLPVGGEAGGKLALLFSRRPSATDLILTVQAAASPAGPWTGLAVSSGGGAFTALVPGTDITETGDGELRALVVRDLYLRSDPAHPRRFMRLQVER
jgi:autotransporter-associated beta strand protein